MALASAAAEAKLIEVRGRTDGELDSVGNQRVARARAEAVRDYLVKLGVPADRIRMTYQAVGDHVASNSSEEGRMQNRRAEVELYSTEPVREVFALRAKPSAVAGESYASRE